MIWIEQMLAGRNVIYHLEIRFRRPDGKLDKAQMRGESESEVDQKFYKWCQDVYPWQFGDYFELEGGSQPEIEGVKLEISFPSETEPACFKVSDDTYRGQACKLLENELQQKPRIPITLHSTTVVNNPYVEASQIEIQKETTTTTTSKKEYGSWFTDPSPKSEPVNKDTVGKYITLPTVEKRKSEEDIQKEKKKVRTNFDFSSW